jgi:hypothetical protein
MKMLVLSAFDQTKLAGMEIIDVSNFLVLVGRFSLNLIAILILVRWLYFSTTKRKDYLFTYILISTIVFLLCYMLENVILEIGFALGLFAIFGIIRYRTQTIAIKEMTYLFLIIGISVMNALTKTSTSILEITFSNLVIIFITYGLEKLWLLKHESSKTITYEKINLIRPEHHDELLEDLQQRTGISEISRIEIGEIDFLRDICYIKIHFETSDRIEKQNNRVGHKKDWDEV